MADLITGRCLKCGRQKGPDTGQPPYRCRCPRESALTVEEFWDVLAARGGRSYFCRPCWTDAWLAAGRPAQALLEADGG